MSKEKYFKEMMDIIKKRKGLCDEKEYVNARYKFTVTCSNGHAWSTNAHYIKRGNWCRQCYGTAKKSLKDMQDLAKKKKGKFLSKSYENNHTKYQWECSEGHIWSAKSSNIKSGKWCPTCAKRAKVTIGDMQEIAKKRGGKCLSDNFKNTSSKIELRCQDGHVWKAKVSHIRSGHWCPYCNHHQSEEAARYVFEQIFKCPFPSTRPDWLRSPLSVKPMELDGYNVDLAIAFEYQGIQHYENVWGVPDEDFQAQKAKDEAKKIICHANNIALVCIPYSLKFEEFASFIERELDMLGYETEPFDFRMKIDFNNVNFVRAELAKLADIAKKRGGHLKSEVYQNDGVKLEWVCKEGHEFSSSSNKVKQGRWCPTCAGKGQTIEDLKKFAAKLKGKCHSQVYVNNSTKYEFSCSEGHHWTATWANVKNHGRWCPKCRGGVKLDIADMREIAARKGGLCLADENPGANVSVLWECANGHQWKATTRKARSNWCKQCNK